MCAEGRALAVLCKEWAVQAWDGAGKPPGMEQRQCSRLMGFSSLCFMLFGLLFACRVVHLSKCLAAPSARMLRAL